MTKLIKKCSKLQFLLFKRCKLQMDSWWTKFKTNSKRYGLLNSNYDNQQ